MTAKTRVGKASLPTSSGLASGIALGGQEAWSAERARCPRCGGEMVLRVAWGTVIGKSFWGCAEYPRCRVTLRFEALEARSD